LIEQLQLVIAKMKRELLVRAPSATQLVLDQPELHLKERAAAAAEE